jgi:beta-N-acetylhexosaminidase
MKRFFTIVAESIFLGISVIHPVFSVGPYSENQYRMVERKIAVKIKDMTLDEKIGQMCMLSFRVWKDDSGSGVQKVTAVNDGIKNIIAGYHIGSVILFSENCSSTENVVRLTSGLQHAALSGGNVPLIIGTDQEGGVITRLEQGTCLPGNMAVGATHNPQCAYDSGRIIGEELSALGINCVFAPVADVNDNPLNPVINLRSFGSNPRFVAEYVEQMQNGIESAGIIACVKHFPGHGNTSTDSHTQFSVVNKNASQWNRCERIPFQRAVNNKIDMVMVSHIQVPSLDNTKVTAVKTGQRVYLPASVSKKIVTGILRNRMKFSGVIVSDAMNMKAVADVFGETDAVVEAIKAGIDIVCMPVSVVSTADIFKLDTVFAAVRDAVSSGELPEKRIDSAVASILRLKYRRNIMCYADVDGSIPQLAERIDAAEKTAGSGEHHAVERQIAEAAVTLVNGKRFVPFKPEKNQKILFVVPYDFEVPSITFAMKRLYREGTTDKLTYESYVYAKETVLTKKMQYKIDEADYVIIVSGLSSFHMNMQNPSLNVIPQTAAAYAAARKAGKHTAVICAGMPYDAFLFPSLPVFIVYNYRGMSQRDIGSAVFRNSYSPNIPAGIEAVFGSFVPSGIVPVDIDVP